MAENLVSFFIDNLGGTFSKELIVFIVSLFPILELRGGIIAGYALGLPLTENFIISFIGNMLPIPFILIFIKLIFKFLKKTRFKNIILKLEDKSINKSDKIQKYGYFGLFLFVAIPLPGTGAWTGALISALLNMEIKKSFFVIAAGVIVAGTIISLLTYGLINGIIN